MSAPTICPVCGDEELAGFLDLPAVPVLSTVFYPDRESARSAPRGDLRLAFCRRCALVWNVAFQPDMVEYTSHYENSQHFSPAFRAYAADLADRLANSYRLDGREVVEIGSGKGEFLVELCERSGCRGVGFDPTFDGEVDESLGQVRILRRYYDHEAATDINAALVLARHVLEHLADPVGFLSDIRAASGPTTPVYYEVPNAAFVFSDAGMWDLIYQHPAYFSAPTLEVALRRAGYEVTDVRESFYGQFLSIEGRPHFSSMPGRVDLDAVDLACRRIETFASRLNARLDQWRECLRTPSDGQVVLWGAGAKGVAFLNLLGDGHWVDRVVDVNPRKTGRFIPGTGHVIESPTALAEDLIQAVLILNPAYDCEIREELLRLGSDAIIYTV